MKKAKSLLLAVHGDSLRQSLQDLLQSVGVQAIKSDNGVDALAAVMNFRPEGAILTAQLPKIDGIRVAQLLRDVEELRDVRLLLVGPQEVEARTLQKLQPALLCPTADVEKIRAGLVQLELIPDVSVAATPAERAKSTAAAGEPDALHKVADMLQGGQVDRAFDLLRVHAQSHPDELRVRGFLDLCRTLLFRQALNEFDNLQLRPRRILSDQQIMNMSLHSDEGFLLSFIDGVTRLRELFYLGGYDRPTTYILLRSLLHRGVIALK
jgi:CheY-like chemotaxis protein